MAADLGCPRPCGDLGVGVVARGDGESGVVTTMGRSKPRCLRPVVELHGSPVKLITMDGEGEATTCGLEWWRRSDVGGGREREENFGLGIN